MPRLEDIKASFTEMSNEELLDKIRKIRADRVIRKGSKTQRVAKVRAKTKLEGLLAALSPEDLKTLFESLE